MSEAQEVLSDLIADMAKTAYQATTKAEVDTVARPPSTSFPPCGR
jgi:hypothetical protein